MDLLIRLIICSGAHLLGPVGTWLKGEIGRNSSCVKFHLNIVAQEEHSHSVVFNRSADKRQCPWAMLLPSLQRAERGEIVKAIAQLQCLEHELDVQEGSSL